jgi:hypothetical protein
VRNTEHVALLEKIYQHMYKTFKTELGTVILIEDENDTQLLGIVPEVSAIDFEWKTGKQSKISVIQIAFYQPEFKQHICLVFRQWNSTLMMQFLSNHKKRKIIASKITSRDSDFIKLALTFRQEFYDGCGFVSLQVLAESKGCPVGLKSLCEKFDLEYQDLHYKFHQKWASQWSLEEEQIMVRYAAHDAILALLLWYKLSALPDAASEKSKYPCRQMMKHGSCSKKDCVYSHSLITCDKCHIVCTDEKGWKQHINGRKHQQTLAELQEEYKSEFHCNECTRNFASQNALRYHMKSMEHRKTLYVLKFKHQKEESQSDKDGFSVSAEGVFDLGVISDVNLHVPLTFVVESKHQVDGYLTDIQFVNKDSNW